MREELPSSEINLEALRGEIATRFPEIDADELLAEDLELYHELKGGIDRKRFDDWRTAVTMSAMGTPNHPRIKFVSLMSRKCELEGDTYTLLPE